MNIRFCFDFDGTIGDLVSEWIRIHNEYEFASLTRDDLIEYDDIVTKASCSQDWMVEQYLKKVHYMNVRPIYPVLNFMKLISETHETVIVTRPVEKCEHHISQKEAWLKRFLKKKLPLVATCDKQVMCRSEDDWLIDDCPEFLEKWPGRKLLIKQPWNRNYHDKFFSISPNEICLVMGTYLTTDNL